MKTIKTFSALSIGILFVIITWAQETVNELPSKGATFKLGVNYNSHLNYYGRTDSLRSSGFFPMAEVWLNKTFYINAAPVFVNNSMSKFEYAGTVATAGYLYMEENNYVTHIYLLKPFYKKTSDLVQSALKAQAGMTFTKLSKVINITGGIDAKFSDKTDIGVTAGMDHIFRYEWKKNAIVIDPSVFVNAGTQQFTNTYYKQSEFIFFPGFEQQVTENVKKFNVLSYEASIPVIYMVRNFQFSLTPAYVVPQNMLIVSNRPDLSERGKEMFYITMGAKISL